MRQNTPYRHLAHLTAKKTKKSKTAKRVPEKTDNIPLFNIKTFTPQFYYIRPVQRIHETVRDKSTKK